MIQPDKSLFFFKLGGKFRTLPSGISDTQPGNFSSYSLTRGSVEIILLPVGFCRMDFQNWQGLRHHTVQMLLLQKRGSTDALWPGSMDSSTSKGGVAWLLPQKGRVAWLGSHGQKVVVPVSSPARSHCEAQPVLRRDLVNTYWIEQQ